ncbi:MAG: malonyl-CoA decarboxylase [Hyphomicrobiaceae bacterium]|nr:malonyl-CoA decarboxylase [Hyphomicrobiaceae bacterium]
MNVSFLQDLLTTVAERGRLYLPEALIGPAREDIAQLVRSLMSGRGEASGVAIARELLDRYRALGQEDRKAFFRLIAHELRPGPDAVKAAAEAYLAGPSEATMQRLRDAVESPRQEFFRRLNLAAGATAEIVAMRRDLLRMGKGEAGFSAVDDDMAHLLSSWFNRGFLVLRRIDWQTPAAILEKIIQYEAVHEIQGWDDLRRRLDPADRRCFAFFHPSLIDEPLIFVEVALTRDIPGHIQNLIGEPAARKALDGSPTTAVFYSISNCQEGLRGISFGNFLIKQVVEELVREQPQLKTFVTLSPVPHFARWLDRVVADEPAHIVTPQDRVALQMLSDPGWIDDPDEADALKPVLMALASHYFLVARSGDGRPVDPVARFHLGNGARLERLNWLGDVSEKGLREAHGLMVNYLYDLKDIERNHEAYANEGEVVASRAVKGLLRPQPRAKGKGETLPMAVVAKPATEKRKESAPGE